MALRYVMLKILILARDRKRRQRLDAVSVYQSILIFLMAKNFVSHDNCSST